MHQTQRIITEKETASTTVILKSAEALQLPEQLLESGSDKTDESSTNTCISAENLKCTVVKTETNLLASKSQETNISSTSTGNSADNLEADNQCALKPSISFEEKKKKEKIRSRSEGKSLASLKPRLPKKPVLTLNPADKKLLGYEEKLSQLDSSTNTQNKETKVKRTKTFSGVTKNNEKLQGSSYLAELQSNLPKKKRNQNGSQEINGKSEIKTNQSIKSENLAKPVSKSVQEKHGFSKLSKPGVNDTVKNKCDEDVSRSPCKKSSDSTLINRKESFEIKASDETSPILNTGPGIINKHQKLSKTMANESKERGLSSKSDAKPTFKPALDKNSSISKPAKSGLKSTATDKVGADSSAPFYGVKLRKVSQNSKSEEDGVRKNEKEHPKVQSSNRNSMNENKAEYLEVEKLVNRRSCGNISFTLHTKDTEANSKPTLESVRKTSSKDNTESSEIQEQNGDGKPLPSWVSIARRRTERFKKDDSESLKKVGCLLRISLTKNF